MRGTAPTQVFVLARIGARISRESLLPVSADSESVFFLYFRASMYITSAKKKMQEKKKNTPETKQWDGQSGTMRL